MDIYDFEDLVSEGPSEDVLNELGEHPEYLTHINSIGFTLLHGAACRNDTKLAQALLSYGLDVNARDNHGDTPLHLVSLHGDPEFVEFLLEHGADINARNDEGMTPLALAPFSREPEWTEVVEILLRHGAEVDLKAAVGLKMLDRVKELLAVPEPLEPADLQTLAEMAFNVNSPEVLDFLLAKGARPTDSMVVRAVHVRLVATLKVILAHGANPNARDPNHDRSVLQIAEELRSGPWQHESELDEVIALLMRYGASA